MSDTVPTPEQIVTLARLARGWKIYQEQDGLHLRKGLPARDGGTVTEEEETTLRRAGWVRWGSITDAGRAVLEAAL